MINRKLIIKHLQEENLKYGSNLKLISYCELVEQIPTEILKGILKEIYGDSNIIELKYNDITAIIYINVLNDNVEIDVDFK